MGSKGLQGIYTLTESVIKNKDQCQMAIFNYLFMLRSSNDALGNPLQPSHMFGGKISSLPLNRMKA